MSASDAYLPEPGDPSRDREAVLALWHGNLGDPARHAGKFDWFYLRNPDGEALLQLLRHGGDVVGCCGAAPRRMLWQGRAIRVGLLADMAVAARHRTLGPALLLQEALVATAASRFDLLYGFPNRKSLPVVKRLGYAVLGERRRYSRVLRSAGYLQRHLPAWLAAPVGVLLDAAMAVRDALRARGGRPPRACWVERADPRMQALWQAHRPARGLVGVRDEAALRWRFDDSPLAGIRYLLLGERADGPPRAWFACQVAGGVLRVCDYWSERGGDLDHRLALALVRAARRGGYTSISLELAAPAARVAGWLRAGFVPREGQPVVGKWLGAAGPTPAELAQDWFLTVGDEDE